MDGPAVVLAPFSLARLGPPFVQVTDLGQVLHMIGGTAAAFIIFFLPGLLLVNAAIVKLDAPPGHTASGDLDAEAPLLVCLVLKMLCLFKDVVVMLMA